MNQDEEIKEQLFGDSTLEQMGMNTPETKASIAKGIAGSLDNAIGEINWTIKTLSEKGGVNQGLLSISNKIKDDLMTARASVKFN